MMALRIASGRRSQPATTRCKSLSHEANSSQAQRPVRCASAARHCSEITQPRERRPVALELAVGSSPTWLAHQSPYRSLPVCQSCQKKFNSRPVAPTIFRNDPFGESVEGLSYFRNKSYAVEAAVQKDGGCRRVSFGRRHKSLVQRRFWQFNQPPLVYRG
jgi:hypothetical protein